MTKSEACSWIQEQLARSGADKHITTRALNLLTTTQLLDVDQIDRLCGELEKLHFCVSRTAMTMALEKIE